MQEIQMQVRNFLIFVCSAGMVTKLKMLYMQTNTLDLLCQDLLMLSSCIEHKENLSCDFYV